MGQGFFEGWAILRVRALPGRDDLAVLAVQHRVRSIVPRLAEDAGIATSGGDYTLPQLYNAAEVLVPARRAACVRS
jgi:hypothetical protein